MNNSVKWTGPSYPDVVELHKIDVGGRPCHPTHAQWMEHRRRKRLTIAVRKVGRYNFLPRSLATSTEVITCTLPYFIAFVVFILKFVRFPPIGEHSASYRKKEYFHKCMRHETYAFSGYFCFFSQNFSTISYLPKKICTQVFKITKIF